MNDFLDFIFDRNKKHKLHYDTLYVGDNGGKYNSKYFFVLNVKEGTFILDKANLKVVSRQSNCEEIKSINYLKMDMRNFSHTSEPAITGSDLVTTMNMLKSSEF